MIRIRDYREDKDMTQKDLAEAIGVSVVAVSRWENELSEINSGNLLKLSNILGVSTDELLGRKSPSPKIIYKEIDNIYQYVVSNLNTFTNSELLRIQGAIEQTLLNRSNSSPSPVITRQDERGATKKGS